MSSDIYIGIDPGIHGGVAFIGDEIGVDAQPMPVKARERGRGKRLDGLQLRHYLSLGHVRLVTIESQHAFPKQGGVGNFTLGGCFDSLLVLCDSLLVAFQLVTPQRWQKHFGISKQTNKGQAISVAQGLFPSVDLVLAGCRKAHDGMADALLIAEWGRRHAGGEQGEARDG